MRIVNDLLNKRLFSLLVPTVRLWATDVVDVAISVNGSVDKKVMQILCTVYHISLSNNGGG